MKFFFAVVFLVCTSQSVQALKPASKKELKELNEIFTTINDIGELIAENRARYDNASPNKKVELNQKYLALKEKREAPCRQALWLTIKAYGILPFEGDRPILPTGKSSFRSPEIGKTITWVPVFEEKIPYDLQNAVGGIAFRNVDIINAAGNTASDGVSRIFPEAFTSPAALASLIYHERIHFKQFTSPPPNRMTSAEFEVAAYSAQKEVWRKNLLGMTPDELEIEADYLKENLAINEAKAVVQRAEVRKAKGLPLDTYSIVSHSEVDIARLIQQARDHVVIAQRDNDERLKRQWIALAHQSCNAPGSVSQRELNALPRLHKREPLDAVMLGGKCHERVYYRLYMGETADAIKREATPPVAAMPPPVVDEPAKIIIGTTFGAILPGLKQYAELACKYQGNIQISGRDTILTPRVPYFMSTNDEADALRVASYLGKCEGHVFRRLFEMLREERGAQITTQWFMNTVASTRAAPPPPATGGGYVSPPQGGGGKNPCQVGDDPFGCQRRHR